MINLNEFSTRRQKELIKRHALNQKQFPKNIKVISPLIVHELCMKTFLQIKQAEIKRQHNEAYNLLSRQYKDLKEKLRSDYAHASNSHLRDEFDSKMKNIKDEQRRKVDLLYRQYEEAVQKMLDQENVRKRLIHRFVIFDLFRFN